MTVEQTESVAVQADRAQPRASFRNWGLGFFWLVFGLLAGGWAAMSYPRSLSYILGVLALYGLYAAWAQGLGVVVRDRFVSAPLPLASWAPSAPIGRTRIPLEALADVTALGVHFGHECVGLSTIDGQFPVLFTSRENRLAFFEALRARKPDARIYRAYR